jgi:hypothetical protein
MNAPETMIASHDWQFVKYKLGRRRVGQIGRMTLLLWWHHRKVRIAHENWKVGTLVPENGADTSASQYGIRLVRGFRTLRCTAP